MNATGLRNFPELAVRSPWPAAGLWTILALFTVVAAGLILTGMGTAAVGALCVATVYAVILPRWQRGIYLLLFDLPISRLVTLALSPWSGPSAFHPVLFKDWLLVVPANLGFLGSTVSRRDRSPRPGLPATPLCAAEFAAGTALFFLGSLALRVPEALACTRYVRWRLLEALR